MEFSPPLKHFGDRDEKIPLSYKKMARDGYTFDCAENQVWLIEKVPPAYLSLHKVNN
ncbi:MAG: hypothetical protein SAL07_16960 [Oscillatoria sp. PMC 1051.18]|nr:hypothetical protein [Oscillatoria sp. PMC 1050.18]MEC5031591.1 hypothetical protein [Oscillatoria sp. PMC 1051.18]